RLEQSNALAAFVTETPRISNSSSNSIIVHLPIGHSRASRVPTELNNSERTGLRLGTERRCSCLAECQRLFRDPAPPAFAPVRGFGGDAGRRRSKPNKGSQRCHRKN